MTTVNELVERVSHLTHDQLQHLALTIVTAWYVNVPMNMVDPDKPLGADELDLVTKTLAELELAPPSSELN